MNATTTTPTNNLAEALRTLTVLADDVVRAHDAARLPDTSPFNALAKAIHALETNADEARGVLDTHDAARNQPAPAPETGITLDLPLSDAFCADVLCNALEGGIGYWSAAAKITHTTIGDDPERHYASATLVDAEGDDDWEHVVDYAAIRRGIRLVLSPGFKVANDIVQATMQAVREDDAGHIDADAADVIVQAACFGELVYG